MPNPYSTSSSRSSSPSRQRQPLVDSQRDQNPPSRSRISSLAGAIGSLIESTAAAAAQARARTSPQPSNTLELPIRPARAGRTDIGTRTPPTRTVELPIRPAEVRTSAHTNRTHRHEPYARLPGTKQRRGATCSHPGLHPLQGRSPCSFHSWPQSPSQSITFSPKREEVTNWSPDNARASHEEATEESALSDMMNALPPPPSPPSLQPVRTYELPIRDSQAHTAAQGNHMGRMEHTTQAFGAEEGRRAPSSIPSDPPRGGQRAPRRPTHQTPAELVDPFWNPHYESPRYGQRIRTWPERRIISILNGWHLEGERDDENKIRLLEEALGAVPAAGVPPSEARESFKEVVNRYRQKVQHEQAEMLMEKTRRD